MRVVWTAHAAGSDRATIMTAQALEIVLARLNLGESILVR